MIKIKEEIASDENVGTGFRYGLKIVIAHWERLSVDDIKAEARKLIDNLKEEEIERVK